MKVVFPTFGHWHKQSLPSVLTTGTPPFKHTTEQAAAPAVDGLLTAGEGARKRAGMGAAAGPGMGSVVNTFPPEGVVICGPPARANLRSRR